jgi:ABC-type dipeptide/oligopeptide/nickel transport system ATPase component
MAELALQSLDIAEYRGLGGMKLEDFGRINLLVGGNNSGKTSVLEALALFARPLDIGNWVEIAWRRDSKGGLQPLAHAVKWLFPRSAGGRADCGRIWITGKGGFAGRKLVAEYVEERVAVSSMRETGTSAEADEAIQHALDLSLDADFEKKLPHRDEWRDYHNRQRVRIIEAESLTYRGAALEPLLRVEVLHADAHRVEATVRDLYSLALANETPQEDLKADFIRLLQRVDPGVQRLDLVQTGRMAPQIQIKHARTGITPLSALGDGFRRALLIAVAIPAVRGGLLLIDELETALHVSVLDSVLGMLRWATEEFNVQVFATTHSLEAVDAVLAALPNAKEDLVGYHLAVEGDLRRAKRYPAELWERLRFERGLDIR